MTGKDLFREIGLISEEYIIEAESVKRSVVANPMFRKSLVTAACLCVCCILYLGVRTLMGGEDTSADSSTNGVQWAEVQRDEETALENYAMQEETSNRNDTVAQVLPESSAEEAGKIVEECQELEDIYDSAATLENDNNEGTVTMDGTSNEDKKDAWSQVGNTTEYAQLASQKSDKRHLESICDRFASYPDSSAELSQEEMVVNVHGTIKAGKDLLTAFMDSVTNGAEATIELVQYTIEGDPMFYYIDYNGADFYVVTDYRRDSFGGNSERVHEYQCSYLQKYEKVFEDGTKVYELVLTDEKELSLEELQTGEYQCLYIMQFSE